MMTPAQVVADLTAKGLLTGRQSARCAPSLEESGNAEGNPPGDCAGGSAAVTLRHHRPRHGVDGDNAVRRSLYFNDQRQAPPPWYLEVARALVSFRLAWS